MELPGAIGIIGGSGLYAMPEIEISGAKDIDTPFGRPSDEFMLGTLMGVEVVFLSRHGRGHRVVAPGVNYRANIFGMKTLGVDTIISVNAVGSMHESYHPTDIVIPDQFFDNTKSRQSTFFPDCPAVHVDIADPVCGVLSGVLLESCREAGARVHMGGICFCIDGPSFSTRAESKIFRSLGADVIGMTLATEAKLAREAEICYASLSMVTDYDVWQEKVEDVTTDLIIANMLKTVDTVRDVLKKAIPRVPAARGCRCRSALEGAIATNPSAVPEEAKARLEPLIGKYLPPEKQVV